MNMSLSEKKEVNGELSLKTALALVILYRAINPAAVAGAARARGAYTVVCVLLLLVLQLSTLLVPEVHALLVCVLLLLVLWFPA